MEHVAITQEVPRRSSTLLVWSSSGIGPPSRAFQPFDDDVMAFVLAATMALPAGIRIKRLLYSFQIGAPQPIGGTSVWEATRLSTWTPQIELEPEAPARAPSSSRSCAER
jgi:hypothetical protein